MVASGIFTLDTVTQKQELNPALIVTLNKHSIRVGPVGPSGSCLQGWVVVGSGTTDGVVNGGWSV